MRTSPWEPFSTRTRSGRRAQTPRTGASTAPTSTMARFELARVERTQGQLDDALKNMEQVVKEEPNWLQPHIELAALYYKMKRPEDGQRERTSSTG